MTSSFVFGVLALSAAAYIAGSPAGAAETTTILQKGKAFSQSEITINQGDSVEFRNDDDTAHNVLSFTPGYEFDLKVQRPGEKKAVTFDKPGQAEIGCDIHPKMKLIVNIK
ncbi:MAG: plastocyanin/azurin family copper-binding protein [Rhodospirillaceae bacterium]